MGMFDAGQFDFADLCDEAVQRSGGETTTAEDIAKVRRSMRILLERWAALRFNTWRIKQTTSGLSAGYPVVVLPRDVDDVFQVNVTNFQGDATGSERTLRRIGAEEYAQLTSKATKGQPSMFYLERTVPAKLYVYPVGRDNVENLNIWYVARPAGFDRNSSEVDAPGRWLEALTCGLALELARKRPVADEPGKYNEPLIQRLKVEADEANLIAQNADRPRTRYRFRMGGVA